MNKIKLFFSTLYRILVASYKILTAPKQKVREPVRSRLTSKEFSENVMKVNKLSREAYLKDYTEKWPDQQPQRIRHKQLEEIVRLCSVENEYNENEQVRIQKMREFVEKNRVKKVK